MAVNEPNIGKQLYIRSHLLWYFWKWKGRRIAHRAENTRVMLKKFVEVTVHLAGINIAQLACLGPDNVDGKICLTTN